MIPPDYKECKESAWQGMETDYFLCVKLTTRPLPKLRIHSIP